MNKVIKKSFNILIKNSAVMQPLILYILLILIFGGIMGTRVFRSTFSVILYSVLMLLLFAAFLSGWVNTIKHAVDNYIKFDVKEKDYHVKISVYNIDTLKKFFPGVGDYFFAVLIPVLVYILFCTGVFISGMKLFHINISDVYAIVSNPNVILKHTDKSYLILSSALLSVSALIQIFQFIIMFWFPVIYYVEVNPVKSLGMAIKFLFKNFFYSVGLYFFIIVSMLVMNILSIICCKIYLLSLLFLIAEFYFVTYLFVLIFTAYKERNLQLEIEKINAQDVFIKSCDVKENKDVDER